MPRLNSIAHLEIRPSPLVADDERTAAALEAALVEAHAQTPEGSTSHVVFVITWIEGGTFVGRVALDRDRYAGLRASLLELAPHRDARPAERELVALARGVRARAWMQDVHALLASAQARAAALRARPAARKLR